MVRDFLEGALLDHEALQRHLVGGASQHLPLHAVSGGQAEHEHGLRLAQPMASIHRLGNGMKTSAIGE